MTTSKKSRENLDGISPRAVDPKVWSLTSSRSTAWEQVRMQTHRPHLNCAEQNLWDQGPAILMLTKA